MTNEELNSYILHYLTKDKTNSAIMLTGDWGTGKSYYIQHSFALFNDAHMIRASFHKFFRRLALRFFVVRY